MKMLFISLFLSFFTILCCAQNDKIDSLYRVLHAATTDSTKVRAYNNLSEAYESYKKDSAIITMQMSLHLAKEIAKDYGEYKFEYYALAKMGILFSSIAHYPKALASNIELLKLAEQQQNSYQLVLANINIAVILQKQKEYQKALDYFLIADSLIEKNNVASLKAETVGNFGNVYLKLNKLDSAYYATMNFYTLAKKSNDTRNLGLALNNLGNIYTIQNNQPAAFKNYYEALTNSTQAEDWDNVCESNLGLANLFEIGKRQDSAISYATAALALANKNGLAARELEANAFITAHYKKLDRLDSAFKYQEQLITLKDTINSSERIKQTLIITIDEELRQHEKQEVLLAEKESRNKTLQLLGVGMLIPSLLLFTLFVSRRKIKPGFIKFCGIASLLMFFECITLLLHPHVVNISGHIPIIELLIFVTIAAFIIPTHHRIEHWLISKLTWNKPKVDK